jgi:hypothetical protein
LAPPPSGALINAVVQHADLIKDLGANQSVLRVSEKRRKDPRVRAALGRDVSRLCDLAVVWDDEQDQLVRVLDGAAADALAAVCAMEPLEPLDIQVTADGSAYLKASGGFAS